MVGVARLASKNENKHSDCVLSKEEIKQFVNSLRTLSNLEQDLYEVIEYRHHLNEETISEIKMKTSSSQASLVKT
jgi:flagellar biosynthesis chaperone FliJ